MILITSRSVHLGFRLVLSVWFTSESWLCVWWSGHLIEQFPWVQACYLWSQDRSWKCHSLQLWWYIFVCHPPCYFPKYGAQAVCVYCSTDIPFKETTFQLIFWSWIFDEKIKKQILRSFTWLQHACSKLPTWSTWLFTCVMLNLWIYSLHFLPKQFIFNMNSLKFI